MKIETFACDVCKVQKKDANHWFKVYILRPLRSKSDDRAPEPTGFVVTTWEAEKPTMTNGDIGEAGHICGHNCATQYISKKLFHGGELTQ